MRIVPLVFVSSTVMLTLCDGLRCASPPPMARPFQGRTRLAAETLADARAAALRDDRAWYMRWIGEEEERVPCDDVGAQFRKAPGLLDATLVPVREHPTGGAKWELYPDLLDFKSMLRRETKWRLKLSGGIFADQIRSEVKWRLRLYRRWLRYVNSSDDEDAGSSGPR